MEEIEIKKESEVYGIGFQEFNVSQYAVAYTDHWAAYGRVYAKKHKAVGKEIGKTSYIERLNSIFRQGMSVVRKTLSFSQKIENHIATIWKFIHYYHTSLHI